MDKYDYAYELSDGQLLRYRSLSPMAKLAWLDQARRFTLLARRRSARAAKRVHRSRES